MYTSSEGVKHSATMFGDLRSPTPKPQYGVLTRRVLDKWCREYGYFSQRVLTSAMPVLEHLASPSNTHLQAQRLKRQSALPKDAGTNMLSNIEVDGIHQPAPPTDAGTYALTRSKVESVQLQFTQPTDADDQGLKPVLERLVQLDDIPSPSIQVEYLPPQSDPPTDADTTVLSAIQLESVQHQPKPSADAGTDVSTSIKIESPKRIAAQANIACKGVANIEEDDSQSRQIERLMREKENLRRENEKLSRENVLSQNDCAAFAKALLRARDLEDQDEATIIQRLPSKSLLETSVKRMFENPFFKSDRRKMMKQKEAEKLARVKVKQEKIVE
jgi:hypothetical protein